jgi:formyltetrahydrofolate-dependent phosphoribosylglycinamide formyltransferase
LNICIFASGTGSNFEAILKAKDSGIIKSNIALLITNNSLCNSVNIAVNNGIKYLHLSRKKYPDLNEDEYSDLFLNALEKEKIDLIVLAGYMKIIDSKIINLFRNRILNIHPALLPSFGGKGMYGINVHKAVIQSGVKVSGLSIHFVNEDYDKGKIIFQKCVNVSERDDEFSLQKKILKLEHKYYSEIISKIESGKIKIGN